MYEVECPDCRHRFDVGEDESLVRCPSCGLELELVASKPEEEEGLEPLPELPGESFTESPCPFCGGMLLVADSDEAGLCAHCKRPLLFDKGRALVDVAAQEPEGRPSEPGLAARPGASTAGSGLPFDPDLQVTSENAPLVEIAPLIEDAESTGPIEGLQEQAEPAAAQSPPAESKETRGSSGPASRRGAKKTPQKRAGRSASKTARKTTKSASKRSSRSKGSAKKSARKGSSSRKGSKGGVKKGDARKRAGSKGAGR